MSTKVENRWHFGIPILEATVTGFVPRRQRLVDHILSLRAADKGLNRSNQNGWHSTNDMFATTDPDLRWLIEQIYALSVSCIRQVEGDRFHGDIPMTECWANVNDAGSWNAPHVHLPNEWSGVFYISVEDVPAHRGSDSLDGDILFINPTPTGPQYNRPPFANYTPKNGQMFIFPGYVPHMVAPHRAPTPRISLAFNFKLVPKKP